MTSYLTRALWTAALLLMVFSGVSARKKYSVGDKFKMECQTKSGEWGPGPQCEETKQDMEFVYGQDTFFSCGRAVSTQELYDTLASYISQEDQLVCRVPMTPERSFFLPFVISHWGVVEEGHFHIDNHMNIVFHADDGLIQGVAAYPVRDKFQHAKLGSVINFHGQVRWFTRYTYVAFSGPIKAPDALVDQSLLILTIGWALLASIVTTILLGVFYQFYLKPNLVKKFLKSD
eukprot:GFYU01009156.1.p1 GENE.GFYU01009156.1~~GFYU01009156.1.p1  ORF type:complete len:232 (+),score=11.26 GFYU01009156.1:89-784(+)